MENQDISNSHHRNKEFTLPVNVFIRANEANLSIKKDKPDCLVKILGKPILFYLLEMLERNFVKEAIILTLGEFSFEINSILQEQYRGSIKTTVVCLNTDQLDEINIFNVIKRKITENNFILLKANCLVDVDLVETFNKHILEDNFMTFLLNKLDLSSVNNENRSKLHTYKDETAMLPSSTYQVYGMQKEISKHHCNITDNNSCCSSGFRNILFASSVSEDKFKLKVDMLNKHEEFILDCSYQDSEFYIFKKSIYNILNLAKVKSFFEIKNQLIPFLINKQDHRIIKKLMETNLKIQAQLLDNDCYKIDSFGQLIGVLGEIQKSVSDIPLIFFPTINNEENIFTEFKQTVVDNMSSNKNPTYGLSDTAKMVSIDSYVCKPFEIVDSKVIKSVIGSNCKVSEKSKISECFIMNNVVIGKK